MTKKLVWDVLATYEELKHPKIGFNPAAIRVLDYL